MVQPGDYEFPVNLLASFLSILSLNRCMRLLSSLEPNSNDLSTPRNGKWDIFFHQFIHTSHTLDLLSTNPT